MSRMKAPQTQIELVGIGIRIRKANISEETLETRLTDSKWKSTLLDWSKVSLFQSGMIRRMEVNK